MITFQFAIACAVVFQGALPVLSAEDALNPAGNGIRGVERSKHENNLNRRLPSKNKGKRRKKENDIDNADSESNDNIFDEFDWGLRFNKFEIIEENGAVGEILPLMASSYPLSQDDADLLRKETSAISVTREEDSHEMQDMKEYGDLSAEKLLEKSGVQLTHPSSNPDSPFWGELLEVINAQIARIYGDSVDNWLQLPPTWEGFDLSDVAEAVHDEFPGSLHALFIGRLFGGALDRTFQKNGPSCANVDRNIIPSLASSEFIRGAVMLSDMNTWAFGAIGPMNFAVKWRYGRARPEEVVWEILNGRTDGVPDGILSLLNEHFSGIAIAPEFTAYPEGSPCHPSFPAMHAASSAASLWMAVVMDLTPEQHCLVKQLDYAIAYARTIAGVHYPTDNIVGLQIGQEILAELLPDHLEHKYGADKDKVKEKIEQVRFDWNEYLNGECFAEATTG